MREKEETAKATQRDGLLSRLLLIFGIILLAMALGIAGYLVWQYADAQLHYSHIQALARPESSSSSPEGSDTYLEDLYFNWDELRLINPDIVAWVIVPGTNINYPVVQGDDNDFYLTHLFDASYSGSGAIFADCLGSPTLDAQNNIIYGHIMFDGSMFSDILHYTGQDFFDQHRRVYLCTPAMNYELSAIATLDIPWNTPIRQFDYTGEDDFRSYLREMLATPVTATPDLSAQIANTEALYSLITCKTFNNGVNRIVLACVPVRSVVPRP